MLSSQEHTSRSCRAGHLAEWLPLPASPQVSSCRGRRRSFSFGGLEAPHPAAALVVRADGFSECRAAVGKRRECAAFLADRVLDVPAFVIADVEVPEVNQQVFQRDNTDLAAGGAAEDNVCGLGHLGSERPRAEAA